MNQPTQRPEPTVTSLVPSPLAASERRTAPRVSLKAEVNLHDETNFFSGFSTDIAAGGLFIATVKLVPLGTQVALQFSLPGGAELSARGQVRWVRSLSDPDSEQRSGLGIQFVELDPEVKQQIEAFIATREPMFFPD